MNKRQFVNDETNRSNSFSSLPSNSLKRLRSVPPARVDIQLSTGQKNALDLVLTGKSIFLTGAAGTGKSKILQLLNELKQDLAVESEVAITASTGVAASNIKGITVHCWAGIGKGEGSVDSLINKVLENGYAVNRWKNVKLLIIDEISMISGGLFDKLSKIAQEVRNDYRPFGGIQVLCCGDFYQLPPVGLEAGATFCFEANAWKELFDKKNSIVLKKMFRQDEIHFYEILNEVRKGEMSSKSIQMLYKKVSHNINNRNDTNPTKLFPRNKEVDIVNKAEFDRLKSQKSNSTEYFLRSEDAMKSQFLSEREGSFIYKAQDIDNSSKHWNQLMHTIHAEAKLELRVGSKVMLIRNIDVLKGLINGVLGEIVDFVITEKSFYPILPIVEFNVPYGKIKEMIKHEEWSIKNKNSSTNDWDIKACRMQLPLKLSWAMTIHKAQGLTIPNLEVSFKNMFDFGQAYVALSRAPTFSQLHLSSFELNGIKTHPKVKKFYQELESNLISPYLADAQLIEFVKKDNLLASFKAMYCEPETTFESPSSVAGRSPVGTSSNFLESDNSEDCTTINNLRDDLEKIVIG